MLNSQSPDTPTQAQDPQRNRYDPAIAGPLALRLTRRDLSPGDLASLRRMNTDRPDSDVFWHLIISYRITDPDSSQHDDVQTEQAWAAIIAAIAHGTSYGQNATTGPHDPTMPLGRALAAADYQPARLHALLSASPGHIRRLTASAAALLHSKGQSYNCADLARLMLTPLRSKAQRDADRTYIARHYNRETYRQNMSPSQ